MFGGGDTTSRTPTIGLSALVSSGQSLTTSNTTVQSDASTSSTIAGFSFGKVASTNQAADETNSLVGKPPFSPQAVPKVKDSIGVDGIAARPQEKSERVPLTDVFRATESTTDPAS